MDDVDALVVEGLHHTPERRQRPIRCRARQGDARAAIVQLDADIQVEVMNRGGETGPIAAVDDKAATVAADRNRFELRQADRAHGNAGLICVATQVVEAGVDMPEAANPSKVLWLTVRLSTPFA